MRKTRLGGSFFGTANAVKSPTALTMVFVKWLMQCITNAQKCYSHDRQNYQRTPAKGALQAD